jgi:hypothetical protein
MIAASIRRAGAALLLSPLIASSVIAAASSDARPRPPSMTTTQYVAELDALASAIDGVDAGAASRASAAITELPTDWRVDDAHRTFDVPLAPLRLEWQAWTSTHDPAARRHLQDHVQMLRAEAMSFTRPALDRAGQHARLADILSGREFADLQGPTWLDRLRQRVLRLLTDSLGRAVPSSFFPSIGRFAVFALIAVAIFSSGRWALRVFQRREPSEMIPGGEAMSSSDWTHRLASAQAAAARGDWRDAVHLTYWCAVAFLESRGAWHPDRARTPREYLHLLPSSSAQAPMLAALTRRFEQVWYGTAHADAQTYADAIDDLKNIGCPSA